MSDDPMIVDARRQRDFISLLANRTAEINKLMRNFDSQLGRLGRDWQDEQFDQFRKQASNTAKALEKFKAESQRLSGRLQQSAQFAEEYARIREG